MDFVDLVYLRDYFAVSTTLSSQFFRFVRIHIMYHRKRYSSSDPRFWISDIDIC